MNDSSNSGHQREYGTQDTDANTSLDPIPAGEIIHQQMEELEEGEIQTSNFADTAEQ